VKRLLIAAAFVISGCSEPSAPTHIECERLSESQKSAIAVNLAEARRLVGSDDEGVLESSDLDRAWAVWSASPPHDREQVRRNLEAFGIAFGELLVKKQGFEWLHCTDDFGSGLAVVALRGAGDATIFPSDFVAKRHERSEGPFFAEAVAQIQETVNATRVKWAQNVPN
jgi:hypothetical protein